MTTSNAGQEASAQKSKGGDARRSRPETQSNRLPRLRRCRCCLEWVRGPGEIVRYRMIQGAAVDSFEPHAEIPRFLSPGSDDPKCWEIERVTVTPRGHRYELIRGGRWVNHWEAQYGRHKDESRLWQRRTARA